jgi:YVTN family beta-propeller protein
VCSQYRRLSRRQAGVADPEGSRSVDGLLRRAPFDVLRVIETGAITNHVNFVSTPRGQFAYVTVGGLNQVKAFRTDTFQQVATIPVGDLPHGIWPSGDGTRVYVGIENGDAVTAIDTATNQVIATIPNGQAAQALVYVPQAVPTETAGVENLQLLGISGAAARMKLAAVGRPTFTTVSLFDQGLTQVLQAAVAGLDPVKPYVLAHSNSDGTGQIEPIARFTTNAAGAQIVNTVGPIRQIIDPSERREHRRYLAILAVQDGKLGRLVQLQQVESLPSGARALQ